MNKENNIVLVGLFAAISVILGVLENFLPMPVPFIRLGLANIAVMIVLYLGTISQALVIMLVKIIIVSILSGNMLFKLSISLPAGLAAFAGMAFCVILLSKYTSAISTGVVGAVCHMFVQLLIIDHFYIFGIISTRLAGVFLLASVVTGIFTGIIANIAVRKIEEIYPTILK